MAEFSRVFDEGDPTKRARYEDSSSDFNVDPSTAPGVSGTESCVYNDYMMMLENSPQMKEAIDALVASPVPPDFQNVSSSPRERSSIPSKIFDSKATEAARTNAAKKVREKYFTLGEAYISGEGPHYVNQNDTGMDVEGEDSSDITALRSYNTTGKDPKSVQLIEPSHDMLVRCIAAILETEVRGSGLDAASYYNLADGTTSASETADAGSLDVNTFNVESAVSNDFRSKLQNREKMQQETVYTYILMYIDWVSRKLHYPAECNIIALTYYYRLASQSDIKMTVINWQNIWVTCISLAIKMWQDIAVRSSQIAEVLTGVSKRNIRDMEALLLKLISYQTTISAQVYAECYFALRGMYGELFPDTDVFWSHPLSIASRRRLELRSRLGQITSRSTNNKPKGTRTNDTGTAKSVKFL